MFGKSTWKGTGTQCVLVANSSKCKSTQINSTQQHQEGQRRSKKNLKKQPQNALNNMSTVTQSAVKMGSKMQNHWHGPLKQ